MVTVTPPLLGGQLTDAEDAPELAPGRTETAAVWMASTTWALHAAQVLDEPPQVGQDRKRLDVSDPLTVEHVLPSGRSQVAVLVGHGRSLAPGPAA